MTDMVQEISTDYGLDDPVEDPLAVLDEQFNDEGLDQELEQLIDSMIAIEQLGMTSDTFETMSQAKLLSGTALESLGLESFRGVTAESPESEMALEALADKVKEKMAAWSAKVFTFLHSMSDKVLSVLSSIKDKVIDQGKALVEKTWDMAKAGVATAKAHPFKTVMAALAAATVVVGIIVIASSSGSYTSPDAIKAMMGRIKSAGDNLKWPFGKVKVEVVEKQVRTFTTYNVTTHAESTVSYTVDGAKTIKELGWSQSAVKVVLQKFNGLWSTTKSAVGGIVSPLVEGAKKINNLGGDMKDFVGNKVAEKTGSKLVGWAANKWVEKLYTTALWSVLGTISVLVKAVLVKAFLIVADTFKKLKSTQPQTA